MSAMSQYQKDFNSHAHVERDLQKFQKSMLQRHFNSHAHVERDIFLDFAYCVSQNFNSHAHVERDTTVKETKAIMSISTHTLTWSVTTY